MNSSCEQVYCPAKRENILQHNFLFFVQNFLLHKLMQYSVLNVFFSSEDRHQSFIHQTMTFSASFCWILYREELTCCHYINVQLASGSQLCSHVLLKLKSLVFNTQILVMFRWLCKSLTLPSMMFSISYGMKLNWLNIKKI